MADENPSPTVPWLRDLEEKIQETGRRIHDLREQNQELNEKNQGLQEQVDELETKLADAPDPEEKAAWQDERDEIRGRVEGLIERLSGLLEETAPSETASKD